MSGLSGRQMTGAERAALLELIRERVATGRLTLGQALWILRARHLGVSRAVYAQATGVSERELAKLESDRGNPTVRTLERVFGPFALRVGLVRAERLGVEVARTELEPAAQQALEQALSDAVTARLRKQWGSR